MAFAARLTRRSAWWLGIGVALMVAVPAMASQDILALVDGIPGAAGGGQIRVKSFSMGYSAPVDEAGGQTVVFAPVTITKVFDETSPVLMEAGGKGTTFGKLVLTGTGVGGVQETVTLVNARVTDWRLVNVAEPAAQAALTKGIEQVTFAVGGISVTHQKLSNAGQLTGSATTGTVGSGK